MTFFLLEEAIMVVVKAGSCTMMSYSIWTNIRMLENLPALAAPLNFKPVRVDCTISTRKLV
jgi:hypothetical protein